MGDVTANPTFCATLTRKPLFLSVLVRPFFRRLICVRLCFLTRLLPSYRGFLPRLCQTRLERIIARRWIQVHDFRQI